MHTSTEFVGVYHILSECSALGWTQSSVLKKVDVLTLQHFYKTGKDAIAFSKRAGEGNQLQNLLSETLSPLLSIAAQIIAPIALAPANRNEQARGVAHNF